MYVDDAVYLLITARFDCCFSLATRFDVFDVQVYLDHNIRGNTAEPGAERYFILQRIWAED